MRKSNRPLLPDLDFIPLCPLPAVLPLPLPGVGGTTSKRENVCCRCVGMQEASVSSGGIGGGGFGSVLRESITDTPREPPLRLAGSGVVGEGPEVNLLQVLRRPAHRPCQLRGLPWSALLEDARSNVEADSGTAKAAGVQRASQHIQRIFAQCQQRGASEDTFLVPSPPLPLRAAPSPPPHPCMHPLDHSCLAHLTGKLVLATAPAKKLL